MNACSECGSSDVTVTGTTLWTLHCHACGAIVVGTAFLADLPEIVEAEQEMAVTFQMTSLNQIRLVRAIAPELLGFSTAELAARARTNGLQVKVSGLTMWRARDYLEKARNAGLEAVIVSGQAEGEAP